MPDAHLINAAVDVHHDDPAFGSRSSPTSRLNAGLRRARTGRRLCSQQRIWSIAYQLWVTEGTVEEHVRSILMKLRSPETSDDHRCVLAVLTFLDSR